MTAQTDLSEHPFSAENIAYELGGSSKSDRAWYRWVAECVRLLGHSLDGNDPAAFDPKQDGEGYSLDEAYEVWERGTTAHAYVAMVTSRTRYHGRVE